MERISQRPTSLLRPGRRDPRTAQLSQAWVRVPQGGEGWQSPVDNTWDRGCQSPGWEKSFAHTGTRRSPPGGSVSLQTGRLPALSLFYWDEIHAQKACAPRAQQRTVCRVNSTQTRPGVSPPHVAPGLLGPGSLPRADQGPTSAGNGCALSGVPPMSPAGWAHLCHTLPPSTTPAVFEVHPH